ncbi:MAG: HNH endonuclease [Lewinellaceae bacterium]|nr:HNH endonuclease [Lewinellaceae bacterium]
MSRMYLNPPGRILHACHIAQFSVTGNNNVRNGIVLCANLHAAFDRGYVGIGKDYEILVNDKLFEELLVYTASKNFEEKESGFLAKGIITVSGIAG